MVETSSLPVVLATAVRQFASTGEAVATVVVLSQAVRESVIPVRVIIVRNNTFVPFQFV
jgi:hypothetical protein